MRTARALRTTQTPAEPRLTAALRTMWVGWTTLDGIEEDLREHGGVLSACVRFESAGQRGEFLCGTDRGEMDCRPNAVHHLPRIRRYHASSWMLPQTTTTHAVPANPAVASQGRRSRRAAIFPARKGSRGQMPTSLSIGIYSGDSKRQNGRRLGWNCGGAVFNQADRTKSRVAGGQGEGLD